mmetsp:Transcript_48516/g.135605  ORF Transcript_48516/g.135605 Transcript_48516/m.135605 type:complete len:213 (+) Transcript_48516:411-1049(+)
MVTAASVVPSSTREIPKSPSLMTEPPPVRKIFEVFKSRWSTFSEWMYCNAKHSCTNQFMISSSEKCSHFFCLVLDGLPQVAPVAIFHDNDQSVRALDEEAVSVAYDVGVRQSLQKEYLLMSEVLVVLIQSHQGDALCHVSGARGCLAHQLCAGVLTPADVLNALETEARQVNVARRFGHVAATRCLPRPTDSNHQLGMRAGAERPIQVRGTA